MPAILMACGRKTTSRCTARENADTTRLQGSMEVSAPVDPVQERARLRNELLHRIIQNEQRRRERLEEEVGNAGGESLSERWCTASV
jgi:hypothetical protein